MEGWHWLSQAGQDPPQLQPAASVFPGPSMHGMANSGCGRHTHSVRVLWRVPGWLYSQVCIDLPGSAAWWCLQAIEAHCCRCVNDCGQIIESAACAAVHAMLWPCDACKHCMAPHLRASGACCAVLSTCAHLLCQPWQCRYRRGRQVNTVSAVHPRFIPLAVCEGSVDASCYNSHSPNSAGREAWMLPNWKRTHSLHAPGLPGQEALWRFCTVCAPP
jgi:hypothetical protein